MFVSRELIRSRAVAETEKAGAALAAQLTRDDIRFPCFVALYGDLGAGKTAFTRGFVSVLSPGSRVKSPTYTVVNDYRRGAVPVFHFDFYRIDGADSLDSIGFEEYLAGGICIGEWSENVRASLPDSAISVTIRKTGEDTRDIEIVREEGETC